MVTISPGLIISHLQSGVSDEGQEAIHDERMHADNQALTKLLVVIGRKVRNHRVKLHCDLTIHHKPELSEVIELVVVDVFENPLRSTDLLHHGQLVIDGPLLNLRKVAFVDDFLDSDCEGIINQEVTEGRSSLETQERSSKVIHGGIASTFFEKVSGNSNIVEALPRTTRRIHLVRLKSSLCSR